MVANYNTVMSIIMLICEPIMMGKSLVVRLPKAPGQTELTLGNEKKGGHEARCCFSFFFVIAFFSIEKKYIYMRYGDGHTFTRFLGLLIFPPTYSERASRNNTTDFFIFFLFEWRATMFCLFAENI